MNLDNDPKAEVVALADLITDRIISLVSSPETAARLTVASALRVSCEGWLKLELLQDLTMFFLSADDIQIRPESVLGTCESSPNRAAADIAVRRGSQEVLIELKTFPTNYGGIGKPITNFIASVVRDLEKLCARRGSATGLVAWLAYPIPAPIPPSWSQHL